MPTLEFNGKHHIYTHHLTVPYRPLETDESRSRNPTGKNDNLIIHGDNLHALKALLPRYKNRIKCIYIDPPYNTHQSRRLEIQRQREKSTYAGMVQGK